MLDRVEQDFLFWRARHIVDTLLSHRKAKGEEVADLEAKLLKFINGSLLGVAEDLRLMQGSKAVLNPKGGHVECARPENIHTRATAN